MRKKRENSNDSDDSDDSLEEHSFRDKKAKKVMSKSMAEEIDAEAEADGTTGLASSVNSEMRPSSVKMNLREIDLERALYRWYERYQEQRKGVVKGEEILESCQLVKKAKSLVQKLGGSIPLLTVVTKTWISRWQERYGVPKPVERTESASSPDIADVPDSSGKSELPDEPLEEHIVEPIKQRFKKKNAKRQDENEVSSSIDAPDFRQALTIDTSWGTAPTTPLESQQTESLSTVFQKYGQDQIYIAFCFRLQWKHLPDRTLENYQEEPVWLLMAGNVSGRHRTRILVTGQQWRPTSLRHVNMLSQPVVYAGGGDGAVTSDLLSWWFHREFIPAAESINPQAVLIVSNEFSLKPDDCVSTDGSVRLILADPKSVDWELVQAEFRTKYTTMLLRSLANSEASLSSTAVVLMLNKITLKEAFPLFHKSWLNLRTDSFQRCCSSILDLQTSESISANLIHSVINVDLINLSTVKEDEPKLPRLCLTRRSGIKSGNAQEDRMLLLELQWLAHYLGMEVTDEDLSIWALETKSIQPKVKCEVPEEDSFEKDIPTAAEAINYLSKGLLWMETMPLEPSLLMVVRDIIDVAKQASKMGLGPPHPGATLPFFCHNGEHLTQPPPAHMGIPPYQLDPKGASAMGEYWRGLNLLRPPSSTSPTTPIPPHPAITPQDWKRAILAGLSSRPHMYPFSASGTYPYPMLSPEISQVASWHTPSMYPISASTPGFRSPYPSGLPLTSTSLPSEFYRFSPTGLLGPGHPGLSPHGHGIPSHHAIITPGPKQELSSHHPQSDHNHRSNSLDKNSTTTHHSSQDSKNSDGSSQNDKKKPHIKKPLNAFMLYMKEMRAKVVAECTLKESAAINQILGRRWHALGREEQAKYYELARRERQLHMQLYPDWSSRANSSRGKKRKRKQEANDGGNNMKKCRARYGLDQQSQWCKPCRRKKKCIRYMESGDDRDGNQSDDNMESCGSVGDANTPPEDDESGAQSMSSPGGLSGLSSLTSLTSPSMILPSPSTSLASPSVSLASPCMSLQSPLTPPTFDMKPILPLPLPPLHRNPVGTNPHDVNNPLSVNQLTGKCIKEPKERSRAISVT